MAQNVVAHLPMRYYIVGCRVEACHVEIGQKYVACSHAVVHKLIEET